MQGVLLYEFLTLQTPFYARERKEMFLNILKVHFSPVLLFSDGSPPTHLSSAAASSLWQE